MTTRTAAGMAVAALAILLGGSACTPAVTPAATPQPRAHPVTFEVSKIAAAPSVIAVLTTKGQVLAKQGSLDGPWISEYTGASQLAVASDGDNGLLLSLIHI